MILAKNRRVVSFILGCHFVRCSRHKPPRERSRGGAPAIRREKRALRQYEHLVPSSRGGPGPPPNTIVVGGLDVPIRTAWLNHLLRKRASKLLLLLRATIPRKTKGYISSSAFIFITDGDDG